MRAVLIEAVNLSGVEEGSKGGLRSRNEDKKGLVASETRSEREQVALTSPSVALEPEEEA